MNTRRIQYPHTQVIADAKGTDGGASKVSLNGADVVIASGGGGAKYKRVRTYANRRSYTETEEKQVGKGGVPEGVDGDYSVAGTKGYDVRPEVTKGAYGSGGGCSNTDKVVYPVSGGSGGINIVTIPVKEGDRLRITVGSAGAGGGIGLAGNAGAVALWYYTLGN